MVALGILTRSAKKNIGSFKASDILNNHQQAYDLLTQAVLSGDEDLISLTSELNRTLQIAPNLINALTAYIKHLKRYSINSEYIQRSQEALGYMTEHLYDTKLSDATYRQAADKLLSIACNASDTTFYLNLIRSFYPFWYDAHSFLLDVNAKSVDQNNRDKQALIDLWDNLDKTFVTTLEESLLARYAKAIKAIDIPDEQIELRTKIAKLILIKQRSCESTPKGYRENINAIRESLSNDDLLTYFLSVSREFYTFWQSVQFSNNPEVG